MKQRTRRKSNGRYAMSWYQHFGPLIALYTTVALGGLLQWHHRELPLISPCPANGCVSNFEVSAHEPETVTEPVKELSVEEIIHEVFGEDGDLMVKIFTCESGLNPETIGDTHIMGMLDGEMVGDSIGVAQIRTGDVGVYDSKPWNRAKANGMTVAEFREKLKDPRYNIEYAKTIFDRQGVTAWYNCMNKVLK